MKLDAKRLDGIESGGLLANVSDAELCALVRELKAWRAADDAWLRGVLVLDARAIRRENEGGE